MFAKKARNSRKHFENSVTVPLKKCKFSVQKPKQWIMKLQNRQAGDLRPERKTVTMWAENAGEAAADRRKRLWRRERSGVPRC
jgi:hypothetical protein